MRAIPVLMSVLSVALLAACAPPVPDSSLSGAGFETPAQYAARRDAELLMGTRAPLVVPPPLATPTEAERLANETRATLGLPPLAPVSLANAIEMPGSISPVSPAAAPLPDAFLPTPLPGAPIAAAPDLDRDNPNLSQEQDFGAVSAERSIEDDAARVNAARQQYQMIQPVELERPQDDSPNIIAYALERARPVGTAGAFRRSTLASARRADQRCGGYRTPDVAQEEFLGAGGPDADRLGLDPDGDGNACAWDPATFRGLVRD